jgi:drug/metabolite transporter (DMT)-like permease
MRLKADLTLLLVSVIWGSAFVAQRVAGQMGSVYLFNGARYLLAALVVVPFAIRAIGSSAPSVKIPPEQYLWMFIVGFVLFGGSAIQQVGLLYTTAGNAGFITSLYVVMVPVLLFLFWREKAHWISVVAVALAGVGAFFLDRAVRRCILDIARDHVGKICLPVRAHVLFGGAVACLRIPESGRRLVCGGVHAL